MAESSYPLFGSDNNPAQIEKLFATMAPDQILPGGLNASTPAGNIVRLSAGRAMAGGWAYENSSTLDLAVEANTGAGTRIDRLVLRKTWTTVAGVTSIQVRAAIKKGTNGAGTPALTQTYGVGVYEVAVARWAVTAGQSTPQLIVSDGPGPGTITWHYSNWQALPASEIGIADLYGKADPNASWGPQPASISDRSLEITTTGIYTLEFVVTSFNQDGSKPDPTYAYITASFPGGTTQQPFDSNFSGAWLTKTGVINAGFLLTPKIYHNSSLTTGCDVTITLTRHKQ